MEYDFSGWATKNNLKCSDGRTIKPNAFKHCDGKVVPLVWNHDHDSPDRVLGHALLENREEGVYAYCSLNETENAQIAKILLQHGDISTLSIYANGLNQNRQGDVFHGEIREVSLVLAGANPGAKIESVITHSALDIDAEEGILYTGEGVELCHGEDSEIVQNEQHEEELSHAAEGKKEDGGKNDMAEEKKVQNANNDDEKTVADVFNSMTEEQKNVVYALIGQALESAKENDDDDDDSDAKKNKNSMKHSAMDYDEEGEEIMKHNAFSDGAEMRQSALTREELKAIIDDAKRFGSLRESFMAHMDNLGLDPEEVLAHSADGIVDARGGSATYGINGVDMLFPDARPLSGTPMFIQRDMSWVNRVLNDAQHTPFSRVKSLFADITADEARAKGYVKGKMKKEEVFGLLKRVTTPTTVYKKQKMDRDDVVDITDFDVIAWLKAEMRVLLNEELARAALISDGRSPIAEDKINEENIRPIWKDADLFTIKAVVDSTATDDNVYWRDVVKTIIRSRREYKGSGDPTFFTTEEVLGEMLLIEDSVGHPLYDTTAKLATALRVKDIVTVPVMENQKNGDKTLLGIVVNMKDYTFGADKGGSINLFDDFDIDYNQFKYLIETRCSGALTRPYSAIAIEALPRAGVTE